MERSSKSTEVQDAEEENVAGCSWTRNLYSKLM